ncbi:hypothetical protein MMC07_005886 [Pseudocyphellaria aurata]|nr:hypothetical protein [Pseudocyphellaria aurata]
MPPAKFANPLEASSYSHPISNSAYAPLRQKIVEKACLMGYDYDSLTEIGLDWSLDQDPNNHVTNSAYPRFASAGNIRLIETFAGVMGDKYSDMFKGKGIGPVLKGYTLDLKRPAAYPDALIVGSRLSEIQPDRYFTTTTVWSLRQQAIVADFKGYVVFMNFDTGRLANLLEAGEPYVALHSQIKAKVEKSNDLFAEWEHKNLGGKKSQL